MKRRKGPNRSRQPKRTTQYRPAPHQGESGWSRKVYKDRVRRSAEQGERQSWTPDDDEEDS